MKTFWRGFLPAICFFALGVISCVFVRDWPVVTLKKDVDPIAMAALLVSILLSVTFYRSLEARKQSDQLRKAATLRVLEAARNHLSGIGDLCAPLDVDYRQVTKALKTGRADFERFDRSAKALGFSISDAKRDSVISVWKDLRTLLTMTPVGQPSSSPIRVSANRLIIRQDALVEVELLVSSGLDILFDFEKMIIEAV